MVVEPCSENCGVSMSPRISFSHDFSQSGVIPVEGQQHPLRSNSSGLNSSIDFDFCVHESSELESSSADELFSDGVILPTEIKKNSNNNNNNAPLKQKGQQPAPHQHHPLPPPYAIIRDNVSSTSKNSKKESKDLNGDEVDEKQSSKSFWRFKRSSSCGSGYGRSLCPLPLLSRSNSTGSSSQSVNKRMPLSKEGANVKQSSQKRPSTIRSSSHSNSHSLAPNNHQKPPLKRSHGANYANSVRVSPVLNVPSANLFGLGSIFSNNRDKSKKK